MKNNFQERNKGLKGNSLLLTLNYINKLNRLPFQGSNAFLLFLKFGK